MLAELRYFVSGAWEPEDSRAVDVYNKRLGHLHDMRSELSDIEYENHRMPFISVGLFSSHHESKQHVPTSGLRSNILELELDLEREQERLHTLGRSVRQ